MTARRRPQRRAKTMLLAGTFAAAVAAGPARADAISADAAQSLERQVHDWLAALLGPQVALGARPLRITAEADHYRLELPFAEPLAAIGVTVQGDPVAAKLTPLDGGRWALDDLRIPSPLHMSYAIPPSGKTGEGGTGQFTATVESQEQHAVLDPSFATPSQWDATVKGYTSSVEGAKDMGTSTMRVDEIITHATVNPAEGGRVNLVQETDSRLLASNTTMPQVGVASFSVGRMHHLVRLNGVAPDRMTTIVHAALSLAPLGVAAAQTEAAANHPDVHALAEQNRKATEDDRRAAEADKAAVAAGRMTPAERKKNAEARHARAVARLQALQAARAQKPPTEAGPSLTAEQRTAVHDALVALADLMDGFEGEQMLEDVRVVAAGHSGHLGKLTSGLSFAAPDGRAAIRLNFALDGMDSPDVPPGVIHDYMPRHIAIAPRIGGLPAADLRDLLLRAADSNGDDPQLQAEAQALLQKGPVVAGLDELSLDFGPATLKGTGEVRVDGIDHYDGEAHFAATGLDELIKQANTVPELAQAAPVLFLLKGMGRQDGATTVWDITYREGKVLINGNDLSAMMPGK